MMKPTDYLNNAELQRFTKKSNARAWRVLLVNWGIIFAAFAMVAIWPNPLTVVLALFIIGARQLGLGVIMHECGHRSFFAADRLNRLVGQWLCAYPILSDLEVYARGHREHHRLAGSADDPDLPNYQAYPVTRSSFRRKLIRDLSGQTGLKLLASVLRGQGDSMTRGKRDYSALFKGIVANAVLAAILAAVGHGELYLLWIGAFLTTYTLVARIRQIAEHAAVTDPLNADPRHNTRTTYTNWLERLFIAPNHVNYHIEHHFLASVPCYRLKALHEHLLAKGFYRQFPQATASGYADVIRHAVPAAA